jgi:predicted deacylase
MFHRIDTVALPPSAIGSTNILQFHRFGPESASEQIYIQASLHADELPGLLVCHHLLKMLDAAERNGRLRKKIVIVPYANPIGLKQVLLGSHEGRFSFASGVNFNRNWIDVTNAVGDRIGNDLIMGDSTHNIALIRRLILEEIDKLTLWKADDVMKKELFRVASVSDIVVDLHCDCG